MSWCSGASRQNVEKPQPGLASGLIRLGAFHAVDVVYILCQLTGALNDARLGHDGRQILGR